MIRNVLLFLLISFVVTNTYCESPNVNKENGNEPTNYAYRILTLVVVSAISYGLYRCFFYTKEQENISEEREKRHHQQQEENQKKEKQEKKRWEERRNKYSKYSYMKKYLPSRIEELYDEMKSTEVLETINQKVFKSKYADKLLDNLDDINKDHKKVVRKFSIDIRVNFLNEGVWARNKQNINRQAEEEYLILFNALIDELKGDEQKENDWSQITKVTVERLVFDSPPLANSQPLAN